MTDSEPSRTVSRRAALTGAAGALVASAGCVRRLRTTVGGDSTGQLVVRITIPVGDYDPFAAPIARHLIDGLEAAGIDYRLTPASQDELYRQVLLAADFDIYIGRLPTDRQPDPDVLYPLLHSKFRGEVGWQNPFGFTNPDCDELLDDQRRERGTDRQETVDSLQSLLGQTQPFVPLVRPEIISGVRRDRFDDWEDAMTEPPTGLLRLNRLDADDGHLTLGTTDPRVTENRNPISATYSYDTSIVSLLYDPLVIESGGERRNWLASGIEWESAATPEQEEAANATVTLREDLQWHDGEPLTAADVAFTFSFLDDTAAGSAASSVPSPRFRQQSSLITAATAFDDRTVRLTFDEASEEVAEGALTAPIFPEHIWSEQTEIASIAGVELSEAATEAMVWDNPEPVGSGPIQFEEATDGSFVTVSRFNDHFLARASNNEDSTDDADGDLAFPVFEELTVDLLSSSPVLVESLSAEDIDATISPLDPAEVERIEDEPPLSLVTALSYASYHLGFNTRSEPFGDPSFRRTIARLCDKAALAAEVFGGYGEPVASPLAGTDWLADELQWDGTDPVAPFLGENGEVDDTRAKDAFRDIGYRYNANDELIV